MTLPPRDRDLDDPWPHPAPGPSGLPEGLQLPPYLMQDEPTRGRTERPRPVSGRFPVPPRDVALVAASVLAGAVGTQLVLRGYTGVLADEPVRVRLGSVLAVGITGCFAVVALPAIVRLCSQSRWAGSAVVAAAPALTAALWAHLHLHVTVMYLQAAAVLASGVAVVLGAAASYYLLAVRPVHTRGPADPDPGVDPEPRPGPRRGRRRRTRCGLWWAVLAYPALAAALCALLAVSLR